MSDDIQIYPIYSKILFVACAIHIPSFTSSLCHPISTISISLQICKRFLQCLVEVIAFEKLGLIARCGVSTGRAYCGVCGSAERDSAFTVREQEASFRRIPA